MNEELDNLTRDVLAASAAGMSYGKWKALHPNTGDYHFEPRLVDQLDTYYNDRIKICPVCGNEFIPGISRQVYCSKVCYAKNNRENTLERYHEQKEDL